MPNELGGFTLRGARRAAAAPRGQARLAVPLLWGWWLGKVAPKPPAAPRASTGGSKDAMCVTFLTSHTSISGAAAK